MVITDVVTQCADETKELGREIAGYLKYGSVVCFRGDLGSGKTCMIQGICEAFGIIEYVNSPTFILINEYNGFLDNTALPIYHFDLYRLCGLDDILELGIEDYLYGKGICLIEWAERADEILPSSRIEIRLNDLGSDRRKIIVKHQS